MATRPEYKWSCLSQLCLHIVNLLNLSILAFHFHSVCGETADFAVGLASRWRILWKVLSSFLLWIQKSRDSFIVMKMEICPNVPFRNMKSSDDAQR